MSNVVFIVGNGFNFLVEHIIRSVPVNDLEPTRYLGRERVANNISKITVLWKKFEAVFKELRQHFSDKGTKVSDEELIKLISSVITFFSNIRGFSDIFTEDEIKKLTDVFDKFLIRKVIEIAAEFSSHESNSEYRQIRQYFTKFAKEFEANADKYGVEHACFFTTNYDAILDVILTRQPSGFVTVDGFGLVPTTDTNESELAVRDRFLRFSSDVLFSARHVMCHIHGSYKYYKRFGKTYKIKGQRSNQSPVIIFNNPEAKGHLISIDNVLSEYMRLFRTLLVSKSTKRIVIFGNSMEAEPHLKETIKEYYPAEGTEIVVVSRSPEKISAQLKGCYEGIIIEQPVEGIDTEEDLIRLFKSFFMNTPIMSVNKPE